MTKARPIMFSGTGGTGKSTIYTQICSELKQAAWPSFTREAYALKGVKSEIESLTLSKEAQEDLQLFIINFFVDKVRSLVESNNSRVPLIFERSIFDHLAYSTQSSPSLGEKLKPLVESFLQDINPVVIYFPYPCPWSNSSSVEDGFRKVDPVKDTNIDSMIKHFKNVYPVKTITLNDFDRQNRLAKVRQIVSDIIQGEI